MQRSEMVGLGVAVLGHAALFALLTLSFCAPPRVEPPHAKPIDVSLVDDVGLVATTPEAADPAVGGSHHRLSLHPGHDLLPCRRTD